MGSVLCPCVSNTSTSNETEVQQQLGVQQVTADEKSSEDEKVFKMLILGTGSNGKSTLFRQWERYIGNKVELDQRAVEETRRIIRDNIRTQLVIYLTQASNASSKDPIKHSKANFDLSDMEMDGQLQAINYSKYNDHIIDYWIRTSHVRPMWVIDINGIVNNYTFGNAQQIYELEGNRTQNEAEKCIAELLLISRNGLNSETERLCKKIDVLIAKQYRLNNERLSDLDYLAETCAGIKEHITILVNGWENMSDSGEEKIAEEYNKKLEILNLLRRRLPVLDSGFHPYLEDLYSNNSQLDQQPIIDYLKQQMPVYSAQQLLEAIPQMTKISAACGVFWRSPQIQYIHENNKFGTDINFSTIPNLDDYWMANYNYRRYFTPNAEITDEDFIRRRKRTTGVVELSFERSGYKYRIHTTGGQRSERKKWIHCFDNVSAVIWVASLNHYCQCLFEDCSQNALIESMAIFQDICQNKYFKKTPIILLLNQSDLFRKKLANGLSLSLCFNENNNSNIMFSMKAEFDVWDTKNDYFNRRINHSRMSAEDILTNGRILNECYEMAIEFVKEQFYKCGLDNGRRVFCAVTCAVDDNSIHKIMDNIHEWMTAESH